MPQLTRILDALRENGAEKINFAGGEPFLYEELLGNLVRHAKEKSGFPSVSIISNGALLKRTWFERYGSYLDYLGISCDSTNPNTNLSHGRAHAGAIKAKDPFIDVRRAASLANEFGIRFKINTVVTNLNKHETGLASLVNETAPERWKIFQVLAIEGENMSSGGTGGGNGSSSVLAIRNAPKAAPFSDLPVTLQDFRNFVLRNSELLRPELSDIIKAEDNETMRSSYIIIDEFGRFLDNSQGSKTPSRPILNAAGEVDIDAAALDLLGKDGLGFDRQAYHQRDGYFSESWSRRLQ